MSNGPSDHGFIEESSEQASEQKSNNVLWIVLGCLGCGGLGIILLGIVAAIALPSFLNQANKARESEAKAYLGSMNRGQQAYFLENRAFSPSIEDLGLGISATTSNYYSYNVAVQPDGASVIITATPLEDPIKHYTGAVFVVGETPDTATTIAQICESPEALTSEAPSLNPTTDTIDCPPGSTPLR